MPFRGAGVILCLAVLPAVPAASGEEEPLVLARVDGEAITLEDLAADFEVRHQGHMSLLGDASALERFLEAAIKRLLFVQEGRRLELDQDPQIRETVAEEQVRAAREWLFSTEVEAKAPVTEEEIARAVDAIHTERAVVRVLTDTEADAREARKRLLDGEDAGAVARAVSRARSRLQGGIERVYWGAEKPEVEDALWKAEDGEVLGPFPVEEGWVVFRVIETVKAEEFDEERARGRARTVLRRRALDRRRAAYLDGLRRRYGAVILEDRLDPDRLAAAVRDGGEKDDILARFEGGSITLADFAGAIRADAFLALRPGQQRLQASFLLSDRLDGELLRLEARRRWSDAPESVNVRVRAIENDLVFRTLLQDHVFRGLEVTDEEVRGWYAEHQEDYRTPVRVQLALALLAQEAEAAAYLAEVKAGGDFAALARERSLDRQTAARGGLAGWVSPDRIIPELKDEVFDLQTGAVGGPVRIEAGWIVYRVVARQEARQRPEEEVREEIRGTLMQDRSSARTRQWEGKLREAATIEILDANLARAVARLEAAEAERYEAGGGSPGHGAEAGDGTQGSPHGGAF